MLRVDCPYTVFARGGNNEQAKVKLSEAEYALVFDAVAEAVLAVKSANPNFSYSSFFASAQRRDPSYVWSLRRNAVGTRAQVVRRKTWWYTVKTTLTNAFARNR